jgi:hypothetical protein
MRDSYEYTGFWWLPNSPENKIYGKLKYIIGKRPTLCLEGAFCENRQKGDFYEIILGDSSGKRITLRSCLRTDFSRVMVANNPKKYYRSEFAVSVFYVGYHFAKKEDIKFVKLVLEFSEFEEWLGERPFCFDHKTEENEIVLRFHRPRMKEISLDEFDIKIGYAPSMGEKCGENQNLRQRRGYQ